MGVYLSLRPHRTHTLSAILGLFARLQSIEKARLNIPGGFRCVILVECATGTVRGNVAFAVASTAACQVRQA
jgi:hypothetical protein